jgi:hypothetical protein
MNGVRIEMTDITTKVTVIALPKKICALPPEIVIAWRKDCSIMPPSTSDSTSGAPGMSTLLEDVADHAEERMRKRSVVLPLMA